MRKIVLLLLVSTVLCCACSGMGEGEAGRLLDEAVRATIDRGETLKGHIRVSVSDQVVLRRESAFFDPEQVRGEAVHAGEPKLESALIGLEELASAAAGVTVHRSREEGDAPVLTVRLDSGRVKEQVQNYFASHKQWLEQKFNVSAASNGESSAASRGVIQAEEQKWRELLDQLDAEATYVIRMDPGGRHIVQLDVETVLRYNKDGTMVEEHINAAYGT